MQCGKTLRLQALTVVRDGFLILTLVIPLLLALGIRWGVPVITPRVTQWVGLRLYTPLMQAYLVVMVPLMMSWIIGFVLVEERDEGVLTAIAVTPRTAGGHIRFLTTTGALTGIVVPFICLLVGGLPPARIPW